MTIYQDIGHIEVRTHQGHLLISCTNKFNKIPILKSMVELMIVCIAAGLTLPETFKRILKFFPYMLEVFQ